MRPLSQDLQDFQRAVMVYTGTFLPEPQGQMARLQQFAAAPLVSVGSTETERPAPGGIDSAADSSGPFVGVSSRSQNNSVLHYYGIDRHDQWIFTPLFR